MAVDFQLTITQRTPHSFDTSDPDAITQWLIGQGFCHLRTRSPHELARLLRGGELIIVYRSGAIVAQGAAADQAVYRLGRLSSARNN